MERDVWPDPSIAQWLAEHAVAVRVDGDARQDLTQRYSVTGYPTIIAFRGDTEVARLSGSRPVPDFLEFLQAADRGCSRLQQLTDQLMIEHDPDRIRALHLEAMSEAGRLQDGSAALGHWRPLWAQRADMPPEQRFEFRWRSARIADIDPQTHAAIDAARMELQPRALASELDADDLDDWLDSCRALGDHAVIADWFTADPKRTDRAEAMARNYQGMWNSLMAAHRYDAIIALTNNDPVTFARQCLSPDAVTGPAVNVFNRHELLRELSVPRVANIYQACLATNRQAQAVQIRDFTLRDFSDSESRAAFDRADSAALTRP
jgi:hypothetical protein